MSKIHKRPFRLSKVAKTGSLYLALRQIYGIGHGRAIEVARSENIRNPKNARFSTLTTARIRRMEIFIESHFQVGQPLHLSVKGSVRKELDIGSYRGTRHRRGLSVRGQRTHGNARTQRHLASGRLRG
jgi:small subunit ribosomal protein S13